MAGHGLSWPSKERKLITKERAITRKVDDMRPSLRSAILLMDWKWTESVVKGRDR